MKRKILLVFGAIGLALFVFSRAFTSYLSKELPELEKNRDSLYRQEKSLNEAEKKIEAFRKDAPLFLEQIKTIKVVKTTREARALYEKFQEEFGFIARISPAKTKGSCVSFEVDFEGGEELLKAMYTFDPHIYFALKKLELTTDKKSVILKGCILYLKQ